MPQGPSTALKMESMKFHEVMVAAMEQLNTEAEEPGLKPDEIYSEDMPEADPDVSLTGIVRYNNVWDMRTHKRKLEKIRPDKPGTPKYKHTLAVKRQINTDGEHVGTDIEVRCTALATLLRGIYGDFEGSRLREQPPVADEALFFHAKLALQFRLATLDETGTSAAELRGSIRTALKYIEEDQAEDTRTFESQLAIGQVSWRLLWMLFRPGELVYRWHELTEQHQVLRFVRLEQTKQHEDWYWELICTVVASDGTKLGECREPLDLRIAQYQGGKDLSLLPVIPLRLKTDCLSIERELIERGKAYIGTIQQGTTYSEVSGFAMRERLGFFDEEEPRNTFRSADKQNDPRNFVKFTASGRAIVDPVTFRMFKPNCPFLPMVRKTLDVTQLKDEHLVICSPVQLGFSFQRKDWCALPVSRLRPVQWRENALQSLIIDDNIKSHIHILVKQHSTSDRAETDVVHGKGGGLIGLIDGNPGCGKTLTAEAVAEVSKRPLYSVSAGELGNTPKDVDKRLTMILELALRWDAVVLLDEADVFLRQRDTSNIKRNAFVSIFLRQLEYFQGILIMTTNRLEDCDTAFESRCHFRLPYPDLNPVSRREVWRNSLKNIERACICGLSVDESDLDTLANRELNGREIRNTVRTASLLANEQAVPLSSAHIQQVLNVATAWKTAMR